MALTVEGNLFEIFDEVQVSERFKKREFVLELEESAGYKEYPKFQLVQAKCALLDNYKQGDRVLLHFNLKGRPYNGRDGQTMYFTNLDVWRIENPAGAAAQQQQGGYDQSAPPHTEADIPYDMQDGKGGGDLPF